MLPLDNKIDHTIDEFEIKGKQFYFKEMCNWNLNRSNYIKAWQSAFQRQDMEESLDWMLGTKLNKTYIIEDSDGIIVSAYSMLKNNCLINKNKIDIGLCNNVFCNKKYFRYKLFDRISHLSLNNSSDYFSFAYGFPNRLAIRGHQRVGWSLPDPIKLYSYQISKIHSRYNSKASSEIRELNSFDSNEAKFFCEKIAQVSREKAEESNNYRISKTSSYYNWRFFQRNILKDRDYYICYNDSAISFFSVYKTDPQLNILDIQWKNNSAFISMIFELINFIKTKSLPGFRFISRELFKLLELELPNLDINVIEQIPLIINEFNDSKAFNPQSINLSFSDYDVY
ncbi:hypothetical protein [Prochlorococcus sp. MIT 1011]|uniref:hypothetical protein n=1 Tax=Prochlorococcus sp. MIT 1011 TaxID=3082520 RepID=UPI0039B681B0